MTLMQRSDGGGVFDTVDRMNGQSLCGCNTIAACQVSPYNLFLHLVWSLIEFFAIFHNFLFPH